MYTLKPFIFIFNSWFDTDLISSGYVVRHVLEASHHPLVPEVVRKRLCPFGQQLHQLGRHLTETNLKHIIWHVMCRLSRHSVILQLFWVLCVKANLLTFLEQHKRSQCGLSLHAAIICVLVCFIVLIKCVPFIFISPVWIWTLSVFSGISLLMK